MFDIFKSCKSVFIAVTYRIAKEGSTNDVITLISYKCCTNERHPSIIFTNNNTFGEIKNDTILVELEILRKKHKYMLDTYWLEINGNAL